MTCPGCGQAAKFQDFRRRQPLSLLGPIRLERAYYSCGRCGHGLAPFDEAAGLTPKRLTPAAERLTALAGLLSDSFEEAAEKVLPEMSGLRLSEATAGRATEAAGGRLRQWRAAGRTLGSPRPWAWHKDAQGRTCAYASIDAICVAQQAKGGGKAEGRMPYVAMLYNPLPEVADTGAARRLPPAAARPSGVAARQQARYLAGLYSLEELGPALRRQAAQVGMERADLWIGLTDGGNGLEDFLRANFGRPDLVVILDFWHAAEYLADLAKALHPHQEELAEEKRQLWSRLLRQEGGAATLAYLREEAWPTTASVQQQWEKVQSYFGNHLHRMEYPEYEAQGWCIGSGVAESGCKTVVSQRLKLAGMRWGKDGTDALCHLRALYLSEKGQWQAFWAPPSPN